MFAPTLFYTTHILQFCSLPNRGSQIFLVYGNTRFLVIFLWVRRPKEIMITIFHIFKKVEQSISMLRRDTEYIIFYKTKIEHKEMKKTISEMKNTLDGINSRSGTQCQR